MSQQHDPVNDVEDESDLAERAAIAKENIPFLDDETAKLVAADQLHPGKINPSSREADNARSQEAQTDADTK